MPSDDDTPATDHRVRDAYDANAELYAQLFLGDLAHDQQTVRWLARFAALAAGRTGRVVDVGCGPGHVTHHLVELGLDAIGIDISPGQIEQARTAFPDIRFEVGDLTALDADEQLGGIVARYSLIHLPPADLDRVFRRWRSVLRPGAPAFVSFFGSRSAHEHGTPFDHKVVTAHRLDPATVGRLLTDAGFERIETEATPIPEGGRPFDHVTMLALASDDASERRD